MSSGCRSLGGGLVKEKVGCCELRNVCWLATGREFLLNSFCRRGFVIGAVLGGEEFAFVAKLDDDMNDGLRG